MFFLYETLSQHLIFPHFPRKISALLLWITFLAIISFNVWARLKLNWPFWSQECAALTKPHLLQAHFKLAQDYRQLGFWQPAKRELLLSEELFQNQTAPENSAVLGVATSPLDILELWQDEPRRLNQAYRFWQQTVISRPDYRDAYLQLGASAYQLGKLSEAKSAWEQALALDPNSALLLELLAHFQTGKQ